MDPTETAQLRLATPADLRAIEAIYNHYVAHSTCTFQYAPEPFERRVQWLEAHGPSHPVTVAERDGRVIGWASLSPFREREGYRQTVEFSVYLDPTVQRQGLGTQLLRDLITRARALGHHVIVGGACTEHAGSLRLQEREGFERVATFREVGRKFDRWLDVAFFQLEL